MRWAGGGAQVQALAVGADDVLLVAEIVAADKAGIDCPLGWPRRFVEFVAQHQADEFVAPVDVAGKDWRRRQALRETDLATRDLAGLVLSHTRPDPSRLRFAGQCEAVGS